MTQDLMIFYSIGTLSVVCASLIAWLVFYKRQSRIPNAIFYLLIVASVYMVIAHWLKLMTLHTYVDFSHWAQVLHSIGKTGKPLSLNQEFYMPGTLNYFSIHFVPLVYIFAIPFKIIFKNETIVVLNYLLMLSSVIPLYKLARMEDASKGFGLFVATLLLWYPTFQYTVMYEFEIMRFSIPVIFWMLYFWECRRMVGYYVCVILVILVREQLGLTIVMFGLYLIVSEKKVKSGLITASMGLVSFLLITQLIMPSLSNSPSIEAPVTRLIAQILENPMAHLLAVVHPVKLGNTFLLFLPLLFVPLFAPVVLLSTAANLGGSLISNTLLHSSYMLYYLSPSVPFIFYAFIKGWPRALSAAREIGVVRAGLPPERVAMATILIGMLTVNVFFGPSPISLQFWSNNLRPAPFKTQSFHYSSYQVTEHHRRAQKFGELIPESAIVSAPQFLHPLLASKRGSMVFPMLEASDGRTRAEYVFFDKTNNGLDPMSPAFVDSTEFDIIEKDTTNWKLLSAEDDYYLYMRQPL